MIHASGLIGASLFLLMLFHVLHDGNVALRTSAHF